MGDRSAIRTSHGIVVTDTGRTVAEAAAEVEGRLATLDQAITARDDALEGPLRIATIDMVAHDDGELFTSFQSRYPGVELTVFTGYERRNLGRDAADIAIRSGLGVGFMPCAYAAQDHTLVPLRPPEPGFDYDVWLLLHAQSRYAARVRAFADHAATYFAPRFAT